MERLLNIDEVSKLLGVEVSTIYSWTSKKKIPFIRLSGKLVRFRESEIQKWLEERSVDPGQQAAHMKSAPGNRLRKIRNPAIADDFVESIVKSAQREVLNGS